MSHKPLGLKFFCCCWYSREGLVYFQNVNLTTRFLWLRLWCLHILPGWNSNASLWLQVLHTVWARQPSNFPSSPWPWWSMLPPSLRAPRAQDGHLLSPLHLRARSLQLSASAFSLVTWLLSFRNSGAYASPPAESGPPILFVWVQSLWWDLTRHSPPSLV